MEPRRVYHLQTHKVTSIGEDRTSKIESILVKLDSTHLLQKYCLFLKQDGIIKSKPPTIVKILIITKDGEKEIIKEAGEDEKEKAQSIVDEILKPSPKKTNYKEAYEEQQKRIDKLEKLFEEKEGKPGSVIETPVTNPVREQLEAKAKELNIAFRSNVGNEKLLMKIQDIQPEYEI